MTKYITIKLTEDQARKILHLLDEDQDLGDDLLGTGPDHEYNAFLRRIVTKISAELVR